jgi:gliding motility-associated-like protein
MPDTTIVVGSVIELWANSPYVFWTQLFGDYLGQGTVLVSPTDSVTYFLADKRHACDVRDTVRIFVVDHIEIPDPPHPITDDNVRFYSGMGCENGTGWITVVICDSVNTGPFTFTWLVNNVIQPSWTDSTRTGLSTGVTYTVMVEDSTGEAVARVITFTLPPPMQIVPRIVNPTVSTCDDGQVSITVSGGVSPYTFHWEDAPGFNSPDRINVGATLYLTVEDSRGCSTAQVGIQLQCAYYRRVMPTLYISPNDDGHNDYLTIFYIEYYPRNRVVIFNSYGVRVRTIENYCNDTPERRWNGRNDRGQLLPDGVYYYVVEADGVEHPMAGWILMRASKQ